MTVPSGNNGSGAGIPAKRRSTVEREVLCDEAFQRMIAIERKRTERSAHPFLLMLLETGEQQSEEKNGQLLAKVISALMTATRETDIVGWHKKRLRRCFVYAARDNRSKIDS